MKDKKLGERLRKIREFSGITQIELAKKLGVSEATIQNWESGGVPAAGKSVVEILSLRNTSAVWLLTGEGEIVREPAPAYREPAPEPPGADLDLAFDIQDILDEDLPDTAPQARRKAMKRIMARLRKNKKAPGENGHRVTAGDESLQVVGNGIRTNGPITKK